MTLMLMLMLTRGVNGTIETNVFLSSINANVIGKVNADTRCEWAVNHSDFSLIVLCPNKTKNKSFSSYISTISVRYSLTSSKIMLLSIIVETRKH